MRLLLGFGHKARHGKDGAALAIMDHVAGVQQVAKKHGYVNRIPEIRKIAFADALRRECDAAITEAGSVMQLLQDGFRDNNGAWIEIPSWVEPTPNPDMSDPLLTNGKHSKLLQWWGTDYRRFQDPDYWVNQVKQTLVGFDGIALITDVRFLNEADFIKRSGGFTIKVSRLNQDGKPFVAPDRLPKHISEISLDGYNWDYYITVKEGDAALKSEYAITLLEHLLGLTAK